MDFVMLDDPEFLDFNFLLGYDPALRPGGGPGHQELYQMVIQARRGDPVGAQEFAGVMGLILRPEAFESFQRTFGARPVGFPDWFFSKLYQFLDILLHESLSALGPGAWVNWGPRQTDKPWEECRRRLTSVGPEIRPDQLERAFDPASHRTYPWLDLVRLCTRAEPADRLEAALQFVREWAKRRRATRKLDPERARRPRGDEETYARDKFIAEQLIRGTAREKICELLDKKRCPVTENMRAKGIETWKAAWNNSDFRKYVQSMFSKAQARFTSAV
jgi:hypothetical protein